jgi:hypothetical protein
MKKCFSLAILLIAAFSVATAQNVQLHYDLGHSLYSDLTPRQSVTTTVEMFKPDRWGSTFMFTDIDYKKDGSIGAYWEIAREFDVTKNKQWAAHVEYNGGATTGETPAGYYGNRFQHVALVGGAWNWHSQDFSKTFSVQLMYKYNFSNHHQNARAYNSVQLTEVWGVNFGKGLCTFSGFADLWYDGSVNGKWVFVSEPQFWFNLNTLKGMKDVNLSVGTEVEVSNNFVWNEDGKNNKFYAIPTIAAKWTF